MSPETFTQTRGGDSYASIAAPMISPGVIDFGTLTHGETETRSLIFSDIGEADAEITISLSESPSWFQVVRCEQLPPDRASQLRFTIAADTANLLPGKRYDGWLLVHGKSENARACLTVRVAEEPEPIKSWRGMGGRFVQLPLLIALALMILAISTGGSISQAFMPWRSLASSDKVASIAVAAPLSNEDLVFTVEENRKLTLYFADPFVGASQRSLSVAGWSPVWSPNGSQVAFISDSDGSEQIYVLNAKTGFIYQLSDSAGYKLSPKWSPDGLRLAFIAGKPNQGRLQIVSVPNAYVESLTEAERSAILYETDQLAEVVQSVYAKPGRVGKIAGYSRHFDWSPNGLSILFDLHDGNKRRIYTAASNRLQMLIDSDVWSTPLWSPDGEQILAASNIGVYVMDVHGENPRKLNAMPASSPHWSLDGKKIAFLTGAEGALWVMDEDGRNVVEVAEVGVVAYTWSTENNTLAYITGKAGSQTPTLYLWVTQIGQAPALVAEVNEAAISWRASKP